MRAIYPLNYFGFIIDTLLNNLTEVDTNNKRKIDKFIDADTVACMIMNPRSELNLLFTK